jgi:hypothetical protein
MPDFIDELKRVAEAIKVTAEAIKAVEQAQSAFDRSATLEVRNTTGRKLIFHDAMHDHGAFSKQPDLPIEPGTSEVYGTRTSGILTGTAGAARWNIEGTDIFYTITWSVPFIGTNGNNSTLEGPGSEHLALLHSGAGGNTNVPMKYMIGERAALGDKHRDWRFCEKCKCLFFAPGIEASDCAAGARHEFNPMSFNFELPHSTPGIAYQGDWAPLRAMRRLVLCRDPEQDGPLSRAGAPVSRGGGVFLSAAHVQRERTGRPPAPGRLAFLHQLLRDVLRIGRRWSRLPRQWQARAPAVPGYRPAPRGASLVVPRGSAALQLSTRARDRPSANGSSGRVGAVPQMRPVVLLAGEHRERLSDGGRP